MELLAGLGVVGEVDATAAPVGEGRADDVSGIRRGSGVATLLLHELDRPALALDGHVALWQERARQLEALVQARSELALTAARELVELAKHAGRIAADLRSCLQLFAPAEAAAPRPRPTPIDDAIDSAVGQLGPMLRTRARLQVVRCPQAIVWARPGLLTRVAVNLLANAGEALAPGAASAHLVRIAAFVRTSQAGLVVEDSGPGIPAARLADVFRPWRSPKGPGRGVGLAIVKAAVDALGGSLRVTRSAAGGARFVVRVPRHAP